MSEIRGEIASFLSAVRDQYAGGIPVSLIRPRSPHKILFLSEQKLTEDQRSFVTDIAVKGLKLTQSQFDIRDGVRSDTAIISENYGVILFGGKHTHPRTLNAPTVQLLETNLEMKKKFWNELKQFAIRGFF